MRALHELRFRSSRDIEVRKLSDLPEEQREAFRELESDSEFYGLFVARPPSSMNVQAVYRQTAELFRTLAVAASLDPAVLAEDGDDIVDLVLDGILEVECDGGFVSGAAALSILCDATPDAMPVSGAARISLDALLHAQDLDTRNPSELALSLYFYNRLPATNFWRTRFPDAQAILAHLGCDRGALHLALERQWTASATPGWLHWANRAGIERNGDDRTYKLYVSPRPERIREAFEVVVRVLSPIPGTQFKIGDSAGGLLRPDKLIAYFSTRAELDEAAGQFCRELAGGDAHGVPFTAPLDDSGLLSWGVDPPASECALQWAGRDSWRLWVARRLGAALAVAGDAASDTAVEPWRFALERARRHGIDTRTWTPSEALWSRS
ncbi:MAG TPA: hypothetical protein VNI54_07400 [Thermoanaerobaculia bacterium]|nr:hypothetical protein [Thermoanaerobaculia bacterium]